MHGKNKKKLCTKFLLARNWPKLYSRDKFQYAAPRVPTLRNSIQQFQVWSVLNADRFTMHFVQGTVCCEGIQATNKQLYSAGPAIVFLPLNSRLYQPAWLAFQWGGSFNVLGTHSVQKLPINLKWRTHAILHTSPLSKSQIRTVNPV